MPKSTIMNRCTAAPYGAHTVSMSLYRSWNLLYSFNLWWDYSR